ncbi:MAG: hypothetical protein AAF414_22355 [Pseudomonadota bacterium]
MRPFVFFIVLLLTGTAQAQVSNWNHFVQDEALEQAFHAALNQAAFEYIQEQQDDGRPAAIIFLDSQRSPSLQLTSSSFRPALLDAAGARAGYVIDYQALTSEGVRVQIGIANFGGGGFGIYAAGIDLGGFVGAEIAGDGAVMLCPVNSAGLKFMYGAIAVASLDDNGSFRVDQDGADAIALRQRILDLTYESYGHTPAE